MPPRYQPKLLITAAAVTGLVLGWLSAGREDREQQQLSDEKSASLLSQRTASSDSWANRLTLDEAFTRFLRGFESGGRDFARAYRETESFREPHRSTLSEWLLEEWVSHDIEGALAFAGFRIELRRKMLVAYARMAPGRALSIALSDAKERRGEVSVVLEAFAEIDPQGAFALAAQHGLEPSAEMAAKWVAQDPRAALRALDDLFAEQPGILPPYELSRLMNQWPAEDRLEGARWLVAWEPGSSKFPIRDLQISLLMKVQADHSEEALVIAEEIGLPWRSRHWILHSWAKHDSHAALDWLDGEWDTLNDEVIGLVVGSIGSHLDFEVLDEVIAGLPADQRKSALRFSCRDRAESMGELLDHVEKYPDEIETDEFQYDQWWHDRTKDARIEDLLAEADGRSRSIQCQLVQCAAERLAEEDPERAADLFAGNHFDDRYAAVLDESPAKEAFGAAIISHWMSVDPDRFAHWLIENPQTNLKEEALEQANNLLAPRYAAAFVERVRQKHGGEP